MKIKKSSKLKFKQLNFNHLTLSTRINNSYQKNSCFFLFRFVLNKKKNDYGTDKLFIHQLSN